MGPEQYLALKITLSVVVTLALYSVLFRENRVYRLVEHVFLGLAAGYTLVATWKDTLYVEWWTKMLGYPSFSAPADQPNVGIWIYAALVPFGLMGYMVFSKKHNWMSKIPVGIILGIWSGQQVAIWWNTWAPQMYSSMQPVVPTTLTPFKPAPFTYDEAGERIGRAPEVIATINTNLYVSQAVTNLIFMVTLLSALSYFLFSFELKGKVMNGMNKLGRWMLMIGFGAIFGSTVMARFALVIDRMSFIWNEWIASLRVLGG